MPTLQEMLGDSYKEGMSVEEVANFFEGKNYADLSTGNYVDKDKYNKQINNLTEQLNATKNELNAKLTDEEKNSRASQEQAQEIERLKQLLSQNTISSNKNVVNSVLMGSRDILGIEANDKDFDTFVDNITTEDDKKTSAIANYVSKVVKDAYEKGKQDATKDAMGNFGKNKGQGGDGDGSGSEIGELGKRLASTVNKKAKFDYFKQDK